ncbi:HAD-IA family hydrolase [Persicobacter psychrovividus]|uniref:Fructose-1-phosphate/6-phosphogluconate phosphatase n=1 Tax=Persicobacter psychrovividus TaxID=387638 RepID=A0ABM7VFP5_9BACT|nr:fructose-1-phosphate/6-phosphogluconate phosphatase [Persicobacter psychrovividus]
MKKQIIIPAHIKGLIFDVDGTLADTMPTHYLAWKAIADRYGFEFPESLFYEWAGKPTTEVTALLNQRHGLSLDIERVSAEKEEAYLALADQVQPISITVDVAKAYHGKLPMSAGTGNIPHLTTHSLKAIGLEEIITTIVTIEDVAKPKPDPETFARCAELMGVAPEDCAVFEDGDHGIAAGKALGMTIFDVRDYLD